MQDFDLESKNNFLNLNSNKEKRLNLIQNYLKKSQIHLEENDLELNFDTFILDLKFPQFDEDSDLIEVTIRYSIFYLEEFDYEKKRHGLRVLNHMMDNITPAKMSLNMRSELIYDTFQKYINDKDSVEFLGDILESMRKLLNIIESKYTSQEHNYKKHSLVVDSMLSNCYMSSNVLVKSIYYNKFCLYVKQMGMYTIRHMEKYLTICLDSIESSKLGYDFEKQEDLIMNSLNLIECLMQTCSLRLHTHSKRIMNYCIKIFYFYSLFLEKSNEYNNVNDEGANDYVIDKVIQISNCLLKINKNGVADSARFDLNNLKANTNLNAHFITLIDKII
ncbi:unnamed protein product [Brachionus calyciflorus]|uniref:Uncharacterized protein n=1 Tax=Brachionus calyciflorus TaxID=104777 RepID=A0A813S4B0_9BILA|nr:unnamed protein product [Brachionus calyciflorus]